MRESLIAGDRGYGGRAWWLKQYPSTRVSFTHTLAVTPQTNRRFSRFHAVSQLTIVLVPLLAAEFRQSFR